MEALNLDFSTIDYASVKWLFLLPAVWMAMDVITGWIQASVNGTWESTKMRKGFYRKSGELLVIVIAFLTENAIPILHELYVAKIMSLYLVVMEALSVIENLDQAGVPVPIFLHDRLKKLKEHTDTGEGL